MKNEIVLNDTQRKRYLGHPRLVELYIILQYDMFYNQLGDDATLSFFRTMCTANVIDYERVRLLLSRYNVVKTSLRENEAQFYKEVALLAALFNKTRYWAAKKWLGVSRATIYVKTYGITVDELYTDEFEKTMNKQIVLSGSKDIYRELLRFRDAIRLLEGVFN